MDACDSDGDSDDEVREHCIRLLARREHSRFELARKLVSKGRDRAVTDRVLDGLAQEGLLSDERFTEQFVRSRIEAGYGPLRIRADLRERGIGSDLAGDYLDGKESDWRERCRAAWARRFNTPPNDRRDWARQSRFLANRGFSGDHVRRVLEQASRHDDIHFESE